MQTLQQVCLTTKQPTNTPTNSPNTTHSATSFQLLLYLLAELLKLHEPVRHPLHALLQLCVALLQVCDLHLQPAWRKHIAAVTHRAQLLPDWSLKPKVLQCLWVKNTRTRTQGARARV